MEADFPSLDTSYPIHSRICESMLNVFFHSCRQERISDYFPIEQSLRFTLELILARGGEAQFEQYINMLVRITICCRDIRRGKGERTAAYALMLVWYEYDARIFNYLIELFIGEYGGWRDVVGIAAYAANSPNQNQNQYHPIIGFCVCKINNQLRSDLQRDIQGDLPEDMKQDLPSSNVAKWIPRENKKDGWMFPLLVDHWFSGFGPGPSSYSHRCKSYRKICSHVTSQIEDVRSSDVGIGGRYYCADAGRLVSELQRIMFPGRELGARSVSRVSEMNAIWARDAKYLDERIIRHSNQNKNILVVMDTGASMGEHNRLFDAVGLACRIVGVSTCRRILTVGHLPAWISLPENMEFSSMAQTIFENIGVCGPKNIRKTFELLAHSCAESGMTEQEIGELIVVYLSDMHYDPHYSDPDADPDQNIHSVISGAFSPKYQTLPRMVYWGIRPRDSTPLPCEYNEPATAVISGESPELMRVFNEQPLEGRRDAYSNLYLFTRKYPV